MKTPEFPLDEPHRTAALDSLNLLDTAPEADFDQIVRIGRSLFGVQMCLVSLVDRNRQWFKARVGLDAAETPRDISFCGHAILTPDVLVVRNALDDERFRDNPLVSGAPHIRFYAGAPIRLPNGYTIGTLCIIDPSPRPDFGDDDIRLLRDLAGTVLGVITVRALRRELDTEKRHSSRLLRGLETMTTPTALLEPDGTIRTSNDAFAQFCDAYPAPGVPVTEVLPIDPAAFDVAVFDSAATRLIGLPGEGSRSVTLHLDLDGFILTGSGEPPVRSQGDDDGDELDLSLYGIS